MSEPVQLTDATARHSLPFLFAGQAQKEAFVNEALALLDALLHPSIIEERALPPATMQPGDTYLVGASAGGDWEGHDGSIAAWQGYHWALAAPVPGMTVLDRSTGERIVFDAGWQRQAVPDTPAGGTTIDVEARAAIADLVGALKNKGILPAN